MPLTIIIIIKNPVANLDGITHNQALDYHDPSVSYKFLGPYLEEKNKDLPSKASIILT